ERQERRPAMPPSDDIVAGPGQPCTFCGEGYGKHTERCDEFRRQVREKMVVPPSDLSARLRSCAAAIRHMGPQRDTPDLCEEAATALERYESAREEMPEPSELIERLLFAEVGGCTCLVKSPDLQYHSQYCHYRLFAESRAALQRYESVRGPV